MAAYSDDGGRTFSAPAQVSDPERQRVVAPALALGPDAVHVGYYDLHDDARDYEGLEGPTWDGTWSLVLATSTDGGARFAPGVVVDDQIAPPERVMLIFTMPPATLAAGRQALCAAWTDARTGDPDAVARCSPDDGKTWHGMVRLNDDRVGNGARQNLPRLSFSADGRLDAIFYDRREDPNGVLADVYYTYSGDGREYAFEYAPSVPAGRVVFRVRNVGGIEHRLVLQPLAEDLPPIDEQLRGTERRAAQPFAGIPDQRPGADTAFAVDLEPGRRYAFICFVVDQDGQSHALKGMASEFRAAGGPRPSVARDGARSPSPTPGDGPSG